jgi:hypothetical protein
LAYGDGIEGIGKDHRVAQGQNGQFGRYFEHVGWISAGLCATIFRIFSFLTDKGTIVIATFSVWD